MSSSGLKPLAMQNGFTQWAPVALGRFTESGRYSTKTAELSKLSQIVAPDEEVFAMAASNE